LATKQRRTIFQELSQGFWSKAATPLPEAVLPSFLLSHFRFSSAHGERREDTKRYSVVGLQKQLKLLHQLGPNPTREEIQYLSVRTGLSIKKLHFIAVDSHRKLGANKSFFCADSSVSVMQRVPTHASCERGVYMWNTECILPRVSPEYVCDVALSPRWFCFVNPEVTLSVLCYWSLR
jgi:hypothetical protein